MPIQSCGRRVAPLRAALFAGAFALALSSPALAADTLSLRDALLRAAAFDPGVAATQARLDAAEAGLRQAGVRPNPTVGVDLENFAGTGGMSLLDRSETTFYYQQTLERGGKRDARSDVARAEIMLAGSRGDVRSLDLLAQVQTAWIEALAAQAQILVADQRLEIALRLERDVGRRVAAARDPLFTGERARTAVAQARIALDQAKDAARNARAALAAYWGGVPDFTLETAPLFTLDLTVPPPLGETPDLLMLAGERDVASARIQLERSRSVQDPTVRGGVRYFGDGSEAAFVLGGSIPLGRYDTNKGAIEQAQAMRVAVERDLDAARIEREREIARLTARRAAAASEIARIDAEVMPSADRAVRLVRDGFNQGGGAFTYMEVVEAERAIIDARARRIELLRSIHLDGVRLDRILARHLPLIARLEAR
jgi:cobalt-zinc-cadmium efflux system outer membrane protein